jgi:hypothetical protein
MVRFNRFAAPRTNMQGAMSHLVLLREFTQGGRRLKAHMRPRACPQKANSAMATRSPCPLARESGATHRPRHVHPINEDGASTRRPDTWIVHTSDARSMYRCPNLSRLLKIISLRLLRMKSLPVAKVSKCAPSTLVPRYHGRYRLDVETTIVE